MKTFKHNFNLRLTAFGVLDVQGIYGYLQALTAVYKYVAEVTEFNPEKRLIDAVPLLELIGETNAELAQLIIEEDERLSDLSNIENH